jgi:arylsulfatase A-like enzyme
MITGAVERPLPHPRTRAFALSAASAALAACAGGGGSTPTPSSAGNVLVIVADDVGVDMIGAYAEHPAHPPTPNIDALAANGVLFRRAYANPTCSPSRATILTGRYGFRTGIGEPIRQDLPDYSLAPDEITLPELLELGLPLGVDTSAIGKWHLGSRFAGEFDHANQQGFDWFQGTLGNLFDGETYFQHEKVTNGLPATSFEYATTEQVDDAIARLSTMREPWLLYVAFNAAHVPFHAPPPNLHTYVLTGTPQTNPVEHYGAAVEAIDTEIGRLLDTLPPAVRAKTTIVFLGDNGSPNEATTTPSVPGNAKGTLYEGGVRVPLIVSGRDVAAPGREVDAFVQTVDLFPAVAEMLGVDVALAMPDARPIDGISLLPYLRDPSQAPLRAWVFAEVFTPNGFGPYSAVGRMVRDTRWKLIERIPGAELFFDMQGLTFEGASLLPGVLTPEQQAGYDALRAQLDALVSG